MHFLLTLAIMVAQQSPLDEDVAKAIDKLYSDKNTESEQGKNELKDIGRKAVAAIVAELKSKRITDETKKAPRVKRALCDVLGEIRDGSSGAYEALVEKLADKDEFGFTIASAAAEALVKIGDDRAAAEFLKLLNDTKRVESDAWLRYHAIRGLGLLRSKEGLEPLKKACGDKAVAMISDEKVHLIRVAAADALGRIRADDAVEEIGKLLNETELNPWTNKSVAWHAARALERITKKSQGSLDGDDKVTAETIKGWQKWYDGEIGQKLVDRTKGRLKTIAAAVEKYKADLGQYPVVLGTLTSKPSKDPKDPAFDPEKWKGPYTKDEEMKDAWGRDFFFKVPGTGAPFDVVSWGASAPNQPAARQWGKGLEADLFHHDAWRAIKRDETKKTIDAVIKAIDAFKAAEGRLPKMLSELKDKPAEAKAWPEGGYLKEITKDGKELPRDGYSFYLRYATPSAHTGADYDLWSAGADDQRGGLDECEDTFSHDKWKASGVEKSKNRIEAIGKALENFRKDQERYPDKLDDLKNKPSYAKKWGQGYTNEPWVDDFGNDLVYTCTETKNGPAEVKSLGADGKAGGTGADEDIVKSLKP